MEIDRRLTRTCVKTDKEMYTLIAAEIVEWRCQHVCGLIKAYISADVLLVSTEQGKLVWLSTAS